MAYKCAICGVNDVQNQGDICESCAIGQDPYAASLRGISNTNTSPTPNSNAQNNIYTPGKGTSRKILIGGAPSSNTDPYGNDMGPQGGCSGNDTASNQRSAGQLPSNQSIAISTGNNTVVAPSVAKGRNKDVPLSSGITKNISVDTEKKSILEKLFRTLLHGIPYTLDDDVTLFQVFPDYTGTSLNVQGNACDQVIVYGKLKAGAVSENNDVEVYGHRDSDNNIVVKRIVNKANGTTITPDRVIPVAVIWGITIAVFIALAFFVAKYGPYGLLWAVILVLCLTNLPLVFKIITAIFGFFISIIKKL